jgi:HEPN domain-containing protein
MELRFMTIDSMDVVLWIKYAQEDYTVAVAMSKAIGNPYGARHACYLCQQSAEKILKAYTIAQGNTLNRTHNLDLLLDECVVHSVDFESLREICQPLTIYVSITRYPPLMEVDESDMKQALLYASRILEFTKAKLKELGYEYNPEQGDSK